MKKRNCAALAAVAAVLLMSALLLTGCDPMDISGLAGKSPNDETSNVPMGTLTININGSANNRTIMPSDFTFDGVTITITGNLPTLNPGAGGTPVVREIAGNASTETFRLPEGNYTVLVEALIDNKVVAIDEDENVAVTTSGGTATIVLKVIDDDSLGGKGTFTWDITFPEENVFEFDTVTITILDSDGIDLNIIEADTYNPDLTDENIGDLELDPGYYRVIIRMTKEKYQARAIPEILHIYRNMTSEYEISLDPLTRNVFDVTFDPNGGDNTGALDTDNVIEIIWNRTVTLPTDEPEQHGFTFEGWYTTDGTEDPDTGVLFGFGTTRIYSDMTVYARWEAIVYPELTINISFTDPSVEITATTASVSLAVLEDTGVAITITGAGVTTANSIWHIVDGTTGDEEVLTGKVGEIININLTEIETALGREIDGDTLTFMVIVEIGGVEYNVTFDVNITIP